jgi:peptide/nickel transport system ATP-binding protein
MDKTDAVAMVKNLFRETELPDIDRIYNSYPHQLSGGQLQRVMIAMALINHPKIIIADEPTTALDVTVQKSIIQLIKRIASDYNSSIIFISHDLGVIAELCQRVVVMQKGEVKEIGTIHEVFHHPKDNYTKGLIACRPPMDKRFKRLPMVSDFLSQDEPQSFVKSLIQSEAEYLNHCKELENKEEYILKVKNLNKSYVKKRNFFGRAIDSHQALKNISFNMKEGEILGLVGESGCGKSTLGKCILRLTEPDSGYVWFDGHDVLSLSDKRMRILRKDFQIIFQDPYSSLNPRMKIGDAIREPMDIHHIGSTKAQRLERVVELLELVGLEADHMNRYPYQFSGGQRQRICISRTLSLNPKFIICDESVSALDVSVQAQVLNLLLDIKDKLKLSYLFISHNIGVVKFFCDNVLVMKQGEIVESGHVEQVITNPQHVYTKMLIDAVPK